MKNWKDSFEIWTKIARSQSIIYRTNNVFLCSRHRLVPLPPIPSHPFASLCVPFARMDIYNENKHLINLKLEFLTFDASPLKPKTGWFELNWFECVCVWVCVWAQFCLLFLIAIGIACCFRCHCSIIYIPYFSLSLSSSLCTFVLRGGRFIKFQCVLLLIPEGQLTPKLF